MLVNTNNKLKIIAIIVTYNAERWIDKCLSSLIASNTLLTIIIIDNNSKDSTLNIIKNNYPEIIIYENKENIGFGKANNLGIKYSLENNADYIFLLNQDVTINPDTIQKLLEFHIVNPKYGIIIPVHLNYKGNNLDKNFSKCVSFNTLNEIKHSEKYFIETNFVNAAAWLLSQKCIAKVGGFDPLFTHYGEDRDYCYRASYHGFKIGVVLNSFIQHFRSNNLNEFHKYKNILYNAGLAHIKDIRSIIYYNYLSWLVDRMGKIMKYFIRLKFSYIFCELEIIIKLFANYNIIKRNREICKNNKAPFVF